MAGCGARSTEPASAQAAKGQTPLFQAAGGQSCGRLRPEAGAKKYGVSRASSAVALAKSPDGAVLAYVADSDEPTLHTVDVTNGREVAVTELHGNPEHVMVLADGRVAVTLRQANQVEVLEPNDRSADALSSRCLVDVPTEPIALAASPDDSTLVVTSAWAHKVTALDGKTLATKFEADVGREPRAIVVSDDGQRAFVAHLVNASLSVVDLTGDKHEVRPLGLGTHKVVGGPGGQTVDPKIRRGCQGYALASAIDTSTTPDGQTLPVPIIGEKPQVQPQPPTPNKPAPVRPAVPAPNPPRTPNMAAGRLFAPFVTVDPGDERITYYGNPNDTVGTEISQVSVIDTAAERVLTRSVLSLRSVGQGATRECLLPRASAFGNGSVYVACLGIDALVEYDARGVDPARNETRRWAVPAGPTGVAIDAAGGLAVVWSQFDRALSLVKLTGEAEPVMQMPLSRKAGFGLTGEAALGRVLYHKSGDGRVSQEGLACASCHPDGREDAITWSTTDGPRNTPMLAGRLADTGPYSWQGNHATLEIHIEDTIKRLRGRGLPQNEIQALTAYLRTAETPHARPATGAEKQRQIEEGKAVFFSAESACSTCHADTKGFTDGTTHDVRVQPTGSPQLLDTPSLRYLSGTAPYFHDGRYQTLQAMVEANDHAMGYTLNLSRGQRLALVAYLESL
jgi:DNA-binding beta-propeller fold protein YncE